MTMQITQGPRRQHYTPEGAERAIEIYYPAGYLYEVFPVHHRGTTFGQRAGVICTLFTVKVWSGKDGDARFLGYAWDPDEETW
jgi:hypothetical protein